MEFGLKITKKAVRAEYGSNPLKRLRRWLAGLAVLCAVAGPADGAEQRTVLFPVRSAVLSSLVDSRVAEIPVTEGCVFQSGETLARLEAEPFRLRASRARAAYREAAAAAAFAAKNVERVRTLYERNGFQSLQELERAVADSEQARARESMAADAVKLAEYDLANCRIAAPYSGRLVRKMAQPGEYVRVGQNVLQILDDRRMYAVIHFDSSRRLKLRHGDEFAVKIDETASEYRGKIVEISADIDPASRTFSVKLELDNPDGRLVAGMSGSVVEPGAAKP